MKQNNIILQASKLSQEQRKMDADQIKERIEQYKATKDGTSKEPILSSKTHKAMTPDQCGKRIRLLKERLKELETSQPANTQQAQAPSNNNSTSDSAEGTDKGTDTIKTFIDNLKKQGWKLNHNKSTKITSLEKTIQLDKASFDFKYVILNSAFNIYTQNVIYSPKTTYSKILSNIILEQQNKTLDLEVKIYKVWREKTENSAAGSSSIIISTDLKNIPLNIKSDQLIKKIQELIKEYDKSQKNDSTSTTASTQTQTKSKPKSKTKNDSTSTTASTQTQTKNSQKPVQKTEDKKLSKRDMKMIASIIDTLQQEEVEALQHKYPILNMYN